MPRRTSAWIALAVSAGIYLLSFVTSHSEALYDSDVLITLFLWSPFAIVFAAVRLWPRLWLVPAVFAFFFAIPVAVDEFERRSGIHPVGTDASTYEQSGMDNLTTSFLAIFAFPATALAIVLVLIARFVARRRRA
jgi:hypothetical protein